MFSLKKPPACLNITRPVFDLLRNGRLINCQGYINSCDPLWLLQFDELRNKISYNNHRLAINGVCYWAHADMAVSRVFITCRNHVVITDIFCQVLEVYV